MLDVWAPRGSLIADQVVDQLDIILDEFEAPRLACLTEAFDMDLGLDEYVLRVSRRLG